MVFESVHHTINGRFFFNKEKKKNAKDCFTVTKEKKIDIKNLLKQIGVKKPPNFMVSLKSSEGT